MATPLLGRSGWSQGRLDCLSPTLGACMKDGIVEPLPDSPNYLSAIPCTQTAAGHVMTWRLIAVVALTLALVPTSQCVAQDSVVNSTINDDASTGFNLDAWIKQKQLQQWPFDWALELRSSYQQGVPDGVLALNLENARFGELAGQRVMVFLPSCMCSSMGLRVHAFAEGGARRELDAPDTITEVHFQDDRLHITYEDDPEAPNCCAEQFRHVRWRLQENEFIVESETMVKTARPLRSGTPD